MQFTSINSLLRITEGILFLDSRVSIRMSNRITNRFLCFAMKIQGQNTPNKRHHGYSPIYTCLLFSLSPYPLLSALPLVAARLQSALAYIASSPSKCSFCKILSSHLSHFTSGRPVLCVCGIYSARTVTRSHPATGTSSASNLIGLSDRSLRQILRR